MELDPNTHFIRARTTGKIELNADSDVLVHSGTKARIEAPVIEIEATTSITQKAPQISSFGNMSWLGYTGTGGTVSINGMAMTLTSNTLVFNSNAISYVGGTMTYNGKNITDSHTHSNTQPGAGFSGSVS